MDDVVIAMILALVGTLVVIGYLAYRFFKIIGNKEGSD